MTTQTKPLESGKQTRELKKGLVETSVLCPACGHDFFLTLPNHIVVATCPNCHWPDMTRRLVKVDDK